MKGIWRRSYSFRAPEADSPRLVVHTHPSTRTFLPLLVLPDMSRAARSMSRHDAATVLLHYRAMGYRLTRTEDRVWL